MRRLLFLLAALPASLYAQACGTGDLLLKNDTLPAVPPPVPTGVAVIPGLCPGEAAMSVLTTPGRCTVRSVSVMFGDGSATAGLTADVDLEIYDGATLLANGRYTLGPMVWSLSGNMNQNLQVSTHALNTFQLPASANVVITSGTLVVGWRVVTNANGSCLTGFTANLCTDASTQCNRGKNVIDAAAPIGGPVDPSTFNFSAIGWPGPLCPSPSYTGNWIIRACVTPTTSISWTGNATPGGQIALSLLATSRPNDFFLVLLSFGTTPGLPTPFGRIPLNGDGLMECSITGCLPSLLNPGNGNLDAFGTAFSILRVPNLAFLRNSGLPIFAGFVTSANPTFTPFTAISSPSTPIVIN